MQKRARLKYVVTVAIDGGGGDLEEYTGSVDVNADAPFALATRLARRDTVRQYRGRLRTAMVILEHADREGAADGQMLHACAKLQTGEVLGETRIPCDGARDSLATLTERAKRTLLSEFAARPVTLTELCLKRNPRHPGPYEAALVLLCSKTLPICKDVLRGIICPLVWASRYDECWTPVNKKLLRNSKST